LVQQVVVQWDATNFGMRWQSARQVWGEKHMNITTVSHAYTNYGSYLNYSQGMCGPNFSLAVVQFLPDSLDLLLVCPGKPH
jgi:hypothetical protein